MKPAFCSTSLPSQYNLGSRSSVRFQILLNSTDPVFPAATSLTPSHFPQISLIYLRHPNLQQVLKRQHLYTRHSYHTSDILINWTPSSSLQIPLQYLSSNLTTSIEASPPTHQTLPSHPPVLSSSRHHHLSNSYQIFLSCNLMTSINPSPAH